MKKSDFGEQADLVSYTNQHLLTKTEAKAATCSEDGNKEYWTCEHCGKYFLSDDANPETAKAVELSETITPALNHKNAITRGASEPTETAPGYSGDRYCPDCDTVFEKGYTYWNEDNLTWKLYEDGTLTISGTGAMKDYDYDSNPSPVYKNSDVKKVVIEDGVTSIGIRAFNACRNLTNITIPDNVTSIGDFAFYYCENLTSVTIPNSVTSIGNSVFENCIALTNITIPDSITSIGDFAFRYCTSLTSIMIPDSVTSIGNAAFESCKGLTSITIPDSVTSIGNSAFFGCSNLTSITISNNITIIKSSTFLNCSSLTSITIPDSVTSIGDFAFYKCSSLASITIPDSVTSIGDDAFSNCESLTAISLSCKSSLKKSDFGDQANLVSYASHTLKKIEAKAATCTENGNIEHWTCEHCGKYFLSDDSNPETAKAVELSEITIPTIKHSYDKNGFCKNDDTHYQPATYNEESEKYEISNAGQLYWFAEQVNSGNASLNAVLTTDIVVNETVLAADGSLGADPDTLRMWRSIGNDDAENIFKGTFDGQGHTISGLYFSNDSNESNVMCASLFGVSAGIIQNVGLEDSYLNHYNISAGICAINNGQIVNCYNAGTILGYGASGICAINSDNGSIENCYNTGVIRGFGLVAGICNMNTGSMKDCYNNNSDITVMTDSTIIDENDEKSYASGICNNNGSSGRIENCYHVGQVSGADVNNNICNLNAGQIENSYYDCNICDKDAITQNESSAVMKNVESKTTKQFASGEVTYLLNGDQSAPAFYQNLATEKYPVLNPQSKAVVRLELIQDESFGEAATTKTTYHNTGDTVALETSPDKAYMYQYFVNEKKISGKTYTIKNNTEMTMKKVPVDIELSEIDTIQLTCQKKMTLDLTEYLKNFVDLKPVQFQLATGSKLPDGLKLTEDGILSGTPKKAATVKTTIVLTAENDSTKEMNLVFIVNAPVTTTTTTITTTTTTKATTTTKPSKTTTTKVTTTTKPNKTTTTKATTTTTTTISSYGDVNLDGMVDILDAVFLNKYLATLIQFSDAQMANADCCQDGVLNDQDTTALMQFIILLI
ncbi:MAG: leucine-rich repeat protein, partial [Anaerobutyricum soehngenii]